MVLKILSNCCVALPELSHPQGCSNHSLAFSAVICLVYSEQQIRATCPSNKFEKVTGRSRRLMSGLVAYLDVSGLMRHDKHFPFVIIIPSLQMIIKLPVDRSIIHSQAVMCSSCWPSWWDAARGEARSSAGEGCEWNAFYLGRRSCLFFCRECMRG